MNEIPVPFSKDAEEGLIGSVLIQPVILFEVDTRPEEFFIHRHRFIWEAMQALAERGKPVDFLTLQDELERMGQLAEIGGPASLFGMINMVPTSLNASAYADIVREKWERRQILQRAQELARAALDEKVALDKSTSPIFQAMTGDLVPKGAAVNIAYFSKQVKEDALVRKADPRDIWGLPTGMKDFDHATGGLQPSEVFYLGGEPGVGKSMLGGQMALQMGVGYGKTENAGKPINEWAGRPGVIYSMEMKGSAFVRRMVSHLANVETQKIKSGRVEEGDWNKFVQAASYLERSPIYISDSPVWTLAGLRADMARLKASHKIEWFLIDYLYLMVSFVGGQMQDHEKANIVSRGVRSIAREFDLAGITINSMTKVGMGSRRPTQEQMMGGSGVIHDADIIAFLTDWMDEDGEDGISLTSAEAQNAKVLWFGKGREMPHPRGRINLVKRVGVPGFSDWPQVSPMSPYPRNGNGKTERIHYGS